MWKELVAIGLLGACVWIALWPGKRQPQGKRPGYITQRRTWHQTCQEINPTRRHRDTHRNHRGF